MMRSVICQKKKEEREWTKQIMPLAPLNTSQRERHSKSSSTFILHTHFPTRQIEESRQGSKRFGGVSRHSANQILMMLNTCTRAYDWVDEG